MVYTKTYKNRKAYKKQKRYAGYYRNYRNAGQKALSMVKFVRKELLNTEKKVLDTAFALSSSLTPYNSSNNNHFISINNMTQGTGDSQRVGRQVKIDSIHIKGMIQTSNNANSQLRIMLILDKHNQDSTIPDLADILDGGLISSAVNNHRTLGYSQRFFIMYDKTFDLVDGDSKETFRFNKYWNTNKIIKFDGSGLIQGNNYYLVAISNQTVASGNSPDFRGKVRIKYIDN